MYFLVTLDLLLGSKPWQDPESSVEHWILQRILYSSRRMLVRDSMNIVPSVTCCIPDLVVAHKVVTPTQDALTAARTPRTRRGRRSRPRRCSPGP